MTGRGKYQKILAKRELSYDDVMTLNNAGKIISGFSGLLCVRHAGEDYLKMVSRSACDYIISLFDVTTQNRF